MNEIDFKFMFRYISYSLAMSIKDDLINSNMKYDIRKTKENGVFYIVFEIDETNQFDTVLIKHIIEKHKISKDGYSYWCELTSEYDEQSIYFPEYVMSSYLETGGMIEFSYFLFEI